jgi:hypothetical protein
MSQRFVCLPKNVSVAEDALKFAPMGFQCERKKSKDSRERPVYGMRRLREKLPSKRHHG